MAKKNKKNLTPPTENKKTPWQLAEEARKELEKLTPNTVEYYQQRADYDEMLTNLHNNNQIPGDFDYNKHMRESYEMVLTNGFERNAGNQITPELLKAQQDYAHDVHACLDKLDNNNRDDLEVAKNNVGTKIAQDCKAMYEAANRGEEIDVRRFAVGLAYGNTIEGFKGYLSQEDGWKLVADQYSGLDEKTQDFVSNFEQFQEAYHNGQELTQDGLVDFIVSRDELRTQVLNDQEVTAALHEAMSKQELSPAEQDKIMAWATCEDPEKSQKMFADLVNGINKIELKGSNEDQLRTLTKIREDAEKKLGELKKAEQQARKDLEASKKAVKQHEERIAKLDKIYPDMPKDVLDRMKEQMQGNPVYQQAQAELEQRYKDARVASAKLEVQSMVCLHAKSEQEQARAAVKLEAAEQRRQNLEKKFEGIGKEAREIGKSVSREWNTIRACHKANWQIDRHNANFIRDIRDSFRVSRVKAAFKHVQETRRDIDKQQQKLLKAANKLAQKEYRRNHRFDFGKAWGKGKDEGPQKFEKGDFEKAMKFLEGHEGLYLNHLRKGLNELREQETKDMKYFDEKVAKLERSIFEERQFIQEVGDPLLQMQEAQELGGGFFAGMATNGLNNELNQMLADTQISFDADLAQMLEDTGHGHINKGSEFKFQDVRGGDHDSQDIGEDGPDIGDDGPVIGE